MSEGFTRTVLRSDDLLSLTLQLSNMKLERRSGRPPALVRADRTQPAHIVFGFPHQHIAEQAFLEYTGAPPPPDPPVGAILSGPSRLVFALPRGVNRIPFRLAELLDWQRLDARLTATAVPRGTIFSGTPPSPSEPGELETAIEAPFRLYLSPTSDGRWAHSAEAVTREERTELWHTRLGVPAADGSVDERTPDARAVRAIWSPDCDQPEPPSQPLPQPLNASDRKNWVHYSADFTRPAPEGEVLPIQAEHVMLTPLGAWLHLLGVWETAAEAEGPGIELPRFGPPQLRRLRDALAEIPERTLRQPSRLKDVAPLQDLAPRLREAVTEASSAIDWRHVDVSAADAIIGALHTGLPRPDSLGLTEWHHRATQGRDHYVRVVIPGFLYPLGHRASLIKVTERQIEPDSQDHATAYLRQRFFIVVQEPLKDYAQVAAAYPHSGRENPFAAVRVATLVTPTLDPPPGSTPDTPNQNDTFIAMVGGQPFRWNLVGTDRDGHAVPLIAPLVWVPAVDTQHHRYDAAKAKSVYEGPGAPPGLRTAAANGAKIAYAESVTGASASEATVLPTETLHLLGEHLLDLSVIGGSAPRFLPKLERADVRVPAIEALLGQTGGGPATTISFDGVFLDHGFEDTQNKGHVFAKIDAPPQVGFSAERSGGVARPDIKVDGLSRLLGPVGNTAKMASGDLDLGAFAEAKILGLVPLKDLIDAGASSFVPGEIPPMANLSPEKLRAMLDDPGTEIKVPLLTNRTVRNGNGTPTAVETQYAWKPKLFKSVDVAGFTLGMPQNNGVVLSALLVTPLSGGEPSLTVTGRLTGLRLDFAKVIALELGEFKFRSEGGRKMDVTAKDVNLVFEGPLDFVNTIRDYVPAQGFSDPPAISATSEGISAGYSLGIPSIGVGVVSIENIALAASLTLPFVEKPAGVRFALSERHSPFLVTVSLFGGGGFFALTVHAGATPEIEAAIEFGGNFSLDIGVASGGVHVMAGFYFKMDAKLVSLTGYLRCGGSLDVLGLVHISVEFYLGLTYQDNGKLWGEATLTVEVDVLCFSASVGLHLERQFAGAAGDPTFAQLVRPRDWKTYCGAFA